MLLLKLQEFTEYTNFDECLEYIQECMIKHGPIDGLLGFSQVHFLCGLKYNYEWALFFFFFVEK